jgi:hypothetical protein
VAGLPDVAHDGRELPVQDLGDPLDLPGQELGTPVEALHRGVEIVGQGDDPLFELRRFAGGDGAIVQDLSDPLEVVLGEEFSEVVDGPFQLAQELGRLMAELIAEGGAGGDDSGMGFAGDEERCPLFAALDLDIVEAGDALELEDGVHSPGDGGPLFQTDQDPDVLHVVGDHFDGADLADLDPLELDGGVEGEAVDGFAEIEHVGGVFLLETVFGQPESEAQQCRGEE